MLNAFWVSTAKVAFDSHVSCWVDKYGFCWACLGATSARRAESFVYYNGLGFLVFLYRVYGAGFDTFWFFTLVTYCSYVQAREIRKNSYSGHSWKYFPFMFFGAEYLAYPASVTL